MLTVFRQAAAEGAVLNVAMQRFDAAEQRQQSLRFALQIRGKSGQIVQQRIESGLCITGEVLSLGAGTGQRDGLLRAAKG